MARMEDSRSGKGGISSSTVACGLDGDGQEDPLPVRREGSVQRLGAQGSDQDIRAGHGAEGEVLDSALLQLHIRIAQLGASPKHTLDGSLGLREEVDELDVGGQQQGPCGHAAQVELGV